MRTLLKPIPLQSPIQNIDSVGGIIGCILVLLEQDNTPDHAIERGYQALKDSVQRELNSLISTIGFGHSEPTQEEIDSMEQRVSDSVTNATEDDVSVWEWLSWGGDEDDKIGTALFKFSYSKIIPVPKTIPLRQRWTDSGLISDNGDWELFGQISSEEIQYSLRRFYTTKGILFTNTLRSVLSSFSLSTFRLLMETS